MLGILKHNDENDCHNFKQSHKKIIEKLRDDNQCTTPSYNTMKTVKHKMNTKLATQYKHGQIEAQQRMHIKTYEETQMNF